MVALFILRDMLSLILTVGLAVSIKMTRRWYEAEASRRELEKSKTEAELKNLKNQLNPHFLLNTLNNIYALIAFDTDKAQKAVQELSKLLRYVLYENQEIYVPLSREAEFIRNYIELMKIRLNDNVTVKSSFNLITGSNTMIAPLIFISLIENAFKHGTSLHWRNGKKVRSFAVSSTVTIRNLMRTKAEAVSDWNKYANAWNCSMPDSISGNVMCRPTIKRMNQCLLSPLKKL